MNEVFKATFNCERARRSRAKVTWGDRFIEVEGDHIGSGSFDLRHFSDTAQTLAAVAAFADSEVEITGIGFIRAKETNRLTAMTTELSKCGVEIIKNPMVCWCVQTNELLRGTNHQYIRRSPNGYVHVFQASCTPNGVSTPIV